MFYVFLFLCSLAFCSLLCYLLFQLLHVLFLFHAYLFLVSSIGRFINQNNISSIPKEAFVGLKNLKYL